MDFYLILIPLAIPAVEQTRFCWYGEILVWPTLTEYTNVLFSERDTSLENLCNSLCKGVLWFALLPLLWCILVLDVSYAKKTSPDTRGTFCPSQATLSQAGERKIRRFKTILWPFCYLRLEPAWNLMCYSFINAVTWAGVQLDKKSSGVKPPPQVPASSTQGELLRSSEFFQGVITPENALSNSFLFKPLCHCPSVKALEGSGESVCFFWRVWGCEAPQCPVLSGALWRQIAANSDFPRFCGLGHAAEPSAGF